MLTLILLDKLLLQFFPGFDLVTTQEQFLHLVHLSFKKSNGGLKLQGFLGLDILVYVILDLLNTLSIVQRILRLRLVIDGWRSIYKHERLRSATEGVFHDLRKDVVTVGNELVP